MIGRVVGVADVPPFEMKSISGRTAHAQPVVPTVERLIAGTIAFAQRVAPYVQRNIAGRDANVECVARCETPSTIRKAAFARFVVPAFTRSAMTNVALDVTTVPTAALQAGRRYGPTWGAQTREAYLSTPRLVQVAIQTGRQNSKSCPTAHGADARWLFSRWHTRARVMRSRSAEKSGHQGRDRLRGRRA